VSRLADAVGWTVHAVLSIALLAFAIELFVSAVLILYRLGKAVL
jgi:hypothetical protein